MLGRAIASCAALFAVVVLLAGCASGETSAAPTSPRSYVVSAQPMAVTGVARVDASRVRITAEVPAPTAVCSRDLAGRITGTEQDLVRVQLTYTSRSEDNARCTATATAATLVAVPPLAKRTLVVDDDTTFVEVPGSATFRQCTGPFGCDGPPRDHCDQGWLDLVGNSGELAPERYVTARGCTQRWLVLDVDATVTGCQGVDGSRPSGCTSRSVRWFAEFRPPGGWVVVASGGAAGCVDVHRTVPAFPSSLCERLPAR